MKKNVSLYFGSGHAPFEAGRDVPIHPDHARNFAAAGLLDGMELDTAAQSGGTSDAEAA